ncbi:response regulator transcription factor [Massilia forsythiae]|uniref:Response regulator transcription factor n=1 Tax=Massilia forsythiae TaxID=2728020 RepID=A0A7Z2VX26_9BURK|nr:response regulator transcription factor [Massilia forsythiae]QJE00977.1 response regulator transcription factor [Massilia forsythiae]
MPHCLVIEDDDETRAYLCDALRAAGYAVQAETSGEDGLRRLQEGRWDVVVLDRMLPGQVDGIGVIERLRARGDATPVLILSALNSVDERVRGLRSGSDDYLTKPFVLSELLARVENLSRRAAWSREVSVLQVADLQLDLRTMRATRGATAIALQPREMRLLEYLMRHEGQIVTRTMLLEGVWEYHFDPQTNVIDVQVSRLRGKIDKDFSPALIHTVRGAGYMLSAQSSAASSHGAAA